MLLVLTVVLRLPVVPAAFTGAVGNTSTITAAAVFPTYEEAVLRDAPTVYYRGNDVAASTTAADTSGNGTTGQYYFVGPSQHHLVTGGPGAGADTATLFPGGTSSNPGVSAYSASFAQTTTQPFTAEVWFKTTTVTGGKLLGFGNQPSNNSFNNDRNIWMSNDGKLHSFIGSSGGPLHSAAAYNDGNWHLTTEVLDPATGIYLYVDGVQVASNPAQLTGQAYTGRWRIGGDTATAGPAPTYYYFSGALDEVAVFHSVLPASRILAHYTAGTSGGSLAAYTATVAADNPWALYHLNDADGTVNQTTVQITLADSSGNARHGAYSNMRPQGVSAGTTGALVPAQGANTSVTYLGSGVGYDPTSRTSPTTFSLELWFRTTTTTGGRLLGFSSTTTANSGNADRQIYLANNGTLHFGHWSGSRQIVSSTTTYNDGQWHHVVATDSPTAMSLYVDTNLVQPTKTNAGTATTYTGFWRWGGDTLASWANASSSYYFNGDLDEIAVYPTVLNRQQIMWHYHANH